MLIILIHPIEQETIFHYILLLYILGFIPYHNGSNGRIHDLEYVAIYAQPVALSPVTPLVSYSTTKLFNTSRTI